ncbi:MAG: cation diffusion facilitator family transporter, partial [Acidimicrobiia bacterium]
RGTGRNRRSGPAGDAHGEAQGVRAAERAGVRHLPRLWWAFLLALVFLAVEAGAAFATNSLALLSDAGHVLADGVGLGMALAAVHLASRGTRHRHPSRTFGMYRLEIVAALANAILLLGVAGYVMVEAVRRMGDPPRVSGGVVLAVAVAGLAANLASYLLLRPGAAESLNVRAAYLDVVADAIASVGVLAGGVAIRVTGFTWIDPAVGAAIGLWILPRAWLLGREAFRVLVQAAPPEVDMATVEADLRSVPGVEGVHRLHLWTLTSDLEVASAHLIVRPDADLHEVLDQAQLLLQDRYHVAHTTLQLEDDDQACADLDW